MTYLDPLANLTSESTTPAEEKLNSTSMDMARGDICPKCENPMKQCKLTATENALHCAKCRTSGPIPE